MPLHFIIYLVTMFCNIDKGLKISKIITVVCPPLTQHETSLYNMPMHIFLLLLFCFRLFNI